MLRTSTARRLAIIFIYAAVALPLGAQEQLQPSTLRLTLRDAVALALKQNPQVQIATLNVATSQQESNIARSALLPSVGVGVSETARRGNSEVMLGRAVPGFPREVGPYGIFEGGAGATTPVFDLSLIRRYQASRAAVQATDYAAKATREQIVLLTVSQYLSAERAVANVRAAQSRVELATALHQLASDLQEYGVGTGIDTLRANVQLQAERQRLIVAQTQQRVALFALARVLGVDPSTQIEITEELARDAVNGEPANVTALSRAFSQRPELAASTAREAALAKAKSAASAARLPSLHADATWGYQGLGIRSSIPAYEYRVRVELPLFTGGRIAAENARAAIEQKKAAQQTAETKQAIAQDVNTASAVLDASRNEVQVTELAVKLAREEVQQARDRFEAGVANNIEVISAQDGLARAEQTHIDALYRLNQARADLARATGEIETTYTR